MYLESTELTYSHQDLGTLNEFGLMCLFGNMHSKALVAGLDHTVEQISDGDGLKLYPAYFYTHLQVPEACPLSGFQAWHPVHLGVEVKRYGKCYLDSTYVAKPESAGVAEPDDWSKGHFPSMRGNSLFTVDVTEDPSVARQIAVPKQGSLVELDSVKKKPASIQWAKKVQKEGQVRSGRPYPWSSRETITYPVIPGRDVATGHAMIFARFGQVMDYAEHVFLEEHLDVSLGDQQRAEYQLLEREILYYDNAYAGDVIDVAVQLSVTKISDWTARVPFYTEAEYQLYRRSNLDLLAVGYAKKGVIGKSWNDLDRLHRPETSHHQST